MATPAPDPSCRACIRYALAALARECEAVTKTPEGQRNDRLNEAAFNLGQLIPNHFLREQDVNERLFDAAKAAGLEQRETLATIASGVTSGMQAKNARDLAEVHAKHELALVASGQDPWADHPRVKTVELPPTEDDLVRERFPLVDWQQLWDDDTEEEFILDPLVPARRLVALYSVPKIGKSLLMLEIAVGISRGVMVLGSTPPRAYRVLYVDFENDLRGDVRTRLQDMRLTPEHLGNLCYLSFPTLAALDSQRGGVELLAAVRVYRCEVVVIDTVSRSVAGEENDNDTWLNFYRHTGVHLKAMGVTLVRLDHSGKDEGKGQRGGSAKMGDVDAVWRMAKVTDDIFRLVCEANRFPISVGDKLLTIERITTPRLFHRIKPTGAKDAIIEAVIEWLEENDWSPSDGYRTLRDNADFHARFPGVGQPTATEALKLWRQRNGYQLEGGKSE